MKKLSQNQINGQFGEALVETKTLGMGLAFHGQNRLETGIDGMIELRDTQTERTLGKWVGVQVKTTAKGSYAAEDESGFEYLLRPEDLEYWRGSNIPVIIVLVRLSDESLYWKHVEAGAPGEPRRLRFDKQTDRYDRSAVDRIASLCVEKNRLGSFVPPLQTGDPGHLTMVRVLIPDEIFVGASLFSSGREAARELVLADPHAPFDWVVRKRMFYSFRDPRDSALSEIVDEASVEAIEPADLDVEEPDVLNCMLELLSRTLSVQLERELVYDKDSRSLYFKALEANQSRKYRYRSLTNETAADVVSVWRGKKGQVVDFH